MDLGGWLSSSSCEAPTALASDMAPGVDDRIICMAASTLLILVALLK